MHIRDRDGAEDAVAEVLRDPGRRGRRGRGDPALLLGRPDAGPSGRPSAAGTARSPATSPIRRRSELREAAARSSPSERLLVETDSPFLAPQPVRGKPNQPANVVATAERLAEVRGNGLRGARAQGRGECRPGLRLVARATDSRACRARRQRRLGQNFLADPNLLDAIVREAAPGARGRGLEVGGGGGALTERLAPAGRCLHVIEMDERLRPELEPLAERGTATSTWSGGTRCGWSSVLASAPDQAGRQPALLDRDPAAPADDRRPPVVAGWLVMVQREIAERLRGLARRPRVRRRRACWCSSHARSTSAAHRRSGGVHPAASSGVGAAAAARAAARRAARADRELVRDAFAHRRKSLARSLELARAGAAGAGPGGAQAIGQPADARAEALAPADFESLAEALWEADDRIGDGRHCGPPRSSTSASTSGPTREDGLHEIASLFEPLELADELRVSEASGEDEVDLRRGSRARTWSRRRLPRCGSAGWGSPPLRIEIEKRMPVAGGPGRRQRRRRGSAAPGPGRARGPARGGRRRWAQTFPRSLPRGPAWSSPAPARWWSRSRAGRARASC